MSYDVVALGELLIDFTDNGRSAQGNPLMEANPGGAPCNVLSMLCNLGKKTAFIGKVGEDIFGRMLADTVREVGIDTRALVFDPDVRTTLAFVHTYENGDRDFSFYRNPGADMMLSKADVDEELIKDTKLFHYGTLSMTAEGAAEATRYAVQIARESGALISFDPNYRPPLWSSVDEAKEAIWWGIKNCDVLKISDNEIEFITGIADIDEGVRAIMDRAGAEGPRLICASMGPDGSKAFYNDMVVFGEPRLREDTIETTGAGDTFMAGVLYHVLKYGIDGFDEEKLRGMLVFANTAASIVTTRKGALRVMPTMSEIEEECR
ncbi:MAG: carbohydrate kinase [Lachnospiraceae bacterium]|nr:carbohydrate kinase [Lachnospiraceae bacterium]